MTILPVYSGHNRILTKTEQNLIFFLKGEVLDKKNKTFFTSYIYSQYGL